MQPEAFFTTRPLRRDTAAVFASPHSGRAYPRAFIRRSALDEQAIRSSEDAFVDHLFDTAPRHGAPFVAATVPRAYIDLNRGAEELDPALIEGVRKSALNPRIASGLGVIPRVVANGKAIYSGRISQAEAEERLESCWRPYHAALRHELDTAHAMFGQAILIDCHSMPHEAMDSVARSGAARPDVVLGDRFGAAAEQAIIDLIEDGFRDAGFKVARNTPFAGAYVTQTYGRPHFGYHAVQVEIDRALYMDEARICPHDGFDAFKRRLEGVIARISQIGRPAGRSLAAE